MARGGVPAASARRLQQRRGRAGWRRGAGPQLAKEGPLLARRTERLRVRTVLVPGKPGRHAGMEQHIPNPGRLATGAAERALAGTAVGLVEALQRWQRPLRFVL